MIKRMTKLKKVLVFTGLLLVVVSVYALNLFHVFGNTDTAWTDNSVKILFVGNSHVFTGNVPRQLKILAKTGGIDISYRDASTNGASLDDTKEKRLLKFKTQLLIM